MTNSPASIRKARREAAATLRSASATFAEVPDGGHTAHTLGLLGHVIDPAAGQ